jgi:hypothetical protein
MRFLHHPEDLIRNKHQMMFFTSAFAIGAGAVGVAAAGASAAVSMSASSRAAKAQGAAAGSYGKKLKKATSQFSAAQQQALGSYGKDVAAYKESEKLPYQMIQDVQAPQYNLGSMIGDAGEISNYYRQQLEAFQPGAAGIRRDSATQLNQAMGVINSYLKGEIPQDVKDQIMRNVAESAGAGFAPATAGKAGGFQVAQGQMARNLGLTSLQLQQTGLAAIPSIQGTAQNWQQLAKAFTADPLDVGRLQLGYQTAAAEVGLQKGRALSGINQSIFGADTSYYNAQQDVNKNIFAANSGLADKIYGAQKENIAASLAAQQATATGISDIGKATSSGLSAYSNILAAKQGLGSYGGYGQPMQQNQYPLGKGTQILVPQYNPKLG